MLLVNATACSIEEVADNLTQEVIAEDSQSIRTQRMTGDPLSASTVSLDNSRLGLLSGIGNRSQRKHAKEVEKPRFAEFTMSHYNVTTFIQKAVAAVVPFDVLGSPQNWVKLNECTVHKTHVTKTTLTDSKAISTFVCARRHENMSMHQILQGIKLDDIGWLKGKQKRKSRTSVSSLIRRREILQDFFLWLFDAFIIDLIRVRTVMIRYVTVC